MQENRVNAAAAPRRTAAFSRNALVMSALFVLGVLAGAIGMSGIRAMRDRLVGAASAKDVETIISLARYGEISKVRSFLRAGGSPKASGPKGNTMVHAAASAGHVRLVRLLLAKGADPDATNGAGETPLILAIGGKYPHVVKALLDAGADAKHRVQPSWRRCGITPLHQVAIQFYTPIMKLLLAHGAKVNAREARRGWTPLHLAAFNGHAKAVRLLLEAGADPALIDWQGRTALDLAKAKGHARVAAIISRAPRRADAPKAGNESEKAE